MKKVILIILVLCILFTITGCNNKESNNEDVHTFNATIIECETNSMIVRPDENEMEYTSSDKIRVSFVGDFNSCVVNDKVKITYEGGINESYPAQIGTTKIEVLK